jgi:hypothetical protein
MPGFPSRGRRRTPAAVTVEWRCHHPDLRPGVLAEEAAHRRRARQQARRIVVLAMQPVMITTKVWNQSLSNSIPLA